jgi:integrase
MAARRGIFERTKGSGIWWIRWTDAEGHKRREKVGNRSAAEKLLAKRHTQKLERKKLPENFRSKAVTFEELCEDALKHSESENGAKQTYELRLRINQLLPVFGFRPADSVKKQEIVDWLTQQARARGWKASSRNRWQATFSLVFRVGIDNEKVERNPAARIRRRTENNGRVRFLSVEEEKTLLQVIDARFSQFRPHLLLSVHTGMRMSEQYSLRWNQVDAERRQIHLAKTKNGRPRTIPLNSVAAAALEQMRCPRKPLTSDPVFPSAWSGDALQGSRGWFPTALVVPHCLEGSGD